MYDLYLLVPCYNEEAVLPESAAVLLQKLRALRAADRIGPGSRLLLVDDGSTDATWRIISSLLEQPEVCALRLAKNRGHQNAVTAGLVCARERADAALSIDADLQDDPDAIDEMVERWRAGAQIVCGVRRSRESDRFLKRATARGFYVLAKLCGAKVIFDHADFRLLSREAIGRLLCYGTEDLFLRGLVTRLGYPIERVRYDRRARTAGESKYSLKKMLHLARRGFESARAKPSDTPQIGELYVAEERLQ